MDVFNLQEHEEKMYTELCLTLCVLLYFSEVVSFLMVMRIIGPGITLPAFCLLCSAFVNYCICLNCSAFFPLQWTKLLDCGTCPAIPV